MRSVVASSGVCAGLLALSAQGHVQPYYAPVPISADALAADPALANYSCWDLRVSVTPDNGTPDRFNVADFETSLSSGNFYSPVGGGDIPVVPTAANLAFDTYVTVPGHIPGDDTVKVFIPGSGDLTGPGSNVAIFPRAGQQQTALNAVWGTLGNTNFNGDYQIARFTVSNDTNGPIVGYVGANSAPNTPMYANAMSFVNGSLIAGPSSAISLIADANRDNRVNSLDFTAVAQNFNHTHASWAQGDFNGDGKVNALDFNAVANNFGTNAGAPLGTLVPEPMSIAGVVALLSLRRRRNS